MLKNTFIIVFFLSFSAVLFADVPNEIVYQGKLKEYSSVVTGTRYMQFDIYAVSSGGTALWTSNPQSIYISSGIFSYTLAPSVDWRTKDLWIQLTVAPSGSSTPSKVLSPREKISAQVFALHALEAETIKSNSDINFVVGTSTFAAITSGGNLKNFVPTGTINAYGGTTAPAGWLLCDGTAYSTSGTYADLFAVIGHNFGGSGGSFNVPDLRGMFLRGLDTLGTYDVNGATRTIGSYQEDTSQGHKHHALDTTYYAVRNEDPGSYTLPAGSGNVLNLSNANTSNPLTDGINGDPRIGAETRSKNIAVNYIIKY